jgi:hypothetical protein
MADWNGWSWVMMMITSGWMGLSRVQVALTVSVDMLRRLQRCAVCCPGPDLKW